MPEPSITRRDAELFLAKVAAARLRTPGEKFLDGERLFHQNAIWMKAGIRMQHPEFNEAQVEAEYGRRLDIARAFDDELFEKVGSLCV